MNHSIPRVSQRRGRAVQPGSTRSNDSDSAATPNNTPCSSSCAGSSGRNGSTAEATSTDSALPTFSAAVTAMEQIDRARGRTRDVAPMRAIYNELSAERPLMPQLGVVDRFFRAAGEALQTMRS